MSASLTVLRLKTLLERREASALKRLGALASAERRAARVIEDVEGELRLRQADFLGHGPRAASGTPPAIAWSASWGAYQEARVRLLHQVRADRAALQGQLTEAAAQVARLRKQIEATGRLAKRAQVAADRLAERRAQGEFDDLSARRRRS